MQEKELSPVQQFYVWLEQELDDLAQNGPKVKRGRKPSKKQYFTYINEKAIVAFNKETNQSLRNKVFNIITHSKYFQYRICNYNIFSVRKNGIHICIVIINPKIRKVF